MQGVNLPYGLWLGKPRSFNKLYSVLCDYSGKFTVGDLVRLILSRVAPD